MLQWAGIVWMWRWMGGGGVTKPTTLCHTDFILICRHCAVVTQFSGERLCSETFFLFLYVVVYGAWNWWRKWSRETSFNVITQQKFWNGILFPSITIVRGLPWPAESGCVGRESPYSEPEWSLTFVQKPSSGNYAETIPVQSKPWHWIFVYSVTKFCSWVVGTPVLYLDFVPKSKALFFFFPGFPSL